MNTSDNSNDTEHQDFDESPDEILAFPRIRRPESSDDMPLRPLPKPFPEMGPGYKPLPFDNKNEKLPEAPWEKQQYADLAPADSKLDANGLPVAKATETKVVEEKVVAKIEPAKEVEVSEKNRIVDFVKEVILSESKNYSENLQKYAQVAVDWINKLTSDWAIRLSKTDSWKFSNRKKYEALGEDKLKTMSTVEKVAYVFEGEKRPEFSKVNEMERIVSFGRDNAKVRELPFSQEEFDRFQAAVLTKLGFWKQGETEDTIKQLVRDKNYKGDRGNYLDYPGCVDTFLDNGLAVRVDFGEDFFRLFVNSDALAAAIDKVKIENSEKVPA